MSLLDALLGRSTPRHYALLDDQRCCRMLMTATRQPAGDHWVEVPEMRLGLIGKTLPHIVPERSEPLRLS
jgi:hypothetical protein